jgi:hypothetical protein
MNFVSHPCYFLYEHEIQTFREGAMFKVVIEYLDSIVISINADNPEIAGQNILRLIREGRVNPTVREISVFRADADIGLDEPLEQIFP